MCSELHLSGLGVKALIFANPLMLPTFSFDVFINEEMNEACYEGLVQLTVSVQWVSQHVSNI
jgi:hypothetical protein